jgi:hypothetical protein
LKPRLQQQLGMVTTVTTVELEATLVVSPKEPKIG